MPVLESTSVPNVSAAAESGEHSQVGDQAPSDVAPVIAKQRRPHRGAGRLGRSALVAVTVLLAVVITFSVASIVGAVTGHWRTAVVLSGSMRPGIQPGDVEVMVPEHVGAVAVGQVLAIEPPGERLTVTHRVIRVDHKDGQVWIVTKGDANNTPDPWGEVRLTGQNAWRIVAVIPKVGWVNVALRSNIWRISILGTIVLLGCAWQMRRIWQPAATRR